MKILFFSATQAEAMRLSATIVQQIRVRRPDSHILTACWGRRPGETTLSLLTEIFSSPVVSDNSPDGNQCLDILMSSLELMGRFEPDIVISHGEFAVLPAAKRSNVRSIYLGAFLPDAGSIDYLSLSAASAIFVFAPPGLFRMPRNAVRPKFLGHVVPACDADINQRDIHRRQHDVPPDGFVISVLCPSGESRYRQRLIEVITPAFLRLEVKPKALIWLTNGDPELWQQGFHGLHGIRCVDLARPGVLREHWFAMSDLLVTNDARSATFQASSMGVRSISIAAAGGQADELALSRLETNIALTLAASDASCFYYYFLRAVEQPGRGIPDRICDFITPETIAREVLASTDAMLVA